MNCEPTTAQRLASELRAALQKSAEYDEIFRPENIVAENERDSEYRGASLEIFLDDPEFLDDITGENSRVETPLIVLARLPSREVALSIRRPLKRLIERLLDEAEKRGLLCEWVPKRFKAFPDSDGRNLRKEYVLKYGYIVATDE